MNINFRSDEAGHAKLLLEALRSFNEIDHEFHVFPMDGHILKVQRSFKLFSPFLGEIIDSLPLTNDVPNIILPDCSATSICHLVDLLTKGCTKPCEDVQAVIDVGKVLNIDVKNLVVDDQTILSKVINGEDELEDGEIKDIEEDYLPLVETQEHKRVVAEIKIAQFSTAFISVPNVMNNNLYFEHPEFECPECNRSFAKKSGLITHMKTTTKHGQNKPMKRTSKHGQNTPNQDVSIPSSKAAFPIKKLSKLPSSSTSSTVATTNPTVLAKEDFYFHYNIVAWSKMTSQVPFFLPAGMAVNAKGDLLVVDSGKCRVQVFDKERNFKFVFNMGVKHEGKVTQDKLAVCPRTGDIVVLELFPKCQLKLFSEKGKCLLVFGKEGLKNPRAIAVDNREKILVVEGKPPSVLIFSKFGSLLSTFSCSGLLDPSSVAVSSQGEIFISDYQTHCVMVYDYSGGVRRRLGGKDVCRRPFGVCLTSSGHVIVADKQGSVMKFTLFGQTGKFLASMRSSLISVICTDMVQASDGCLVVSSKDNHLYFFNYSNHV